MRRQTSTAWFSWLRGAGCWLVAITWRDGSPRIAAAPGAAGVAGEAAASGQPLVIRLGVQAALADGQQAEGERVAVQVGADVRGVHDRRSR
jgi:hypothetical protein